MKSVCVPNSWEHLAAVGKEKDMLKRSVPWPVLKISYWSQIWENSKCNVSGSYFSPVASLVLPEESELGFNVLSPHPLCSQPLWGLFPWGLWSSLSHVSNLVPSNTVPDTQALNKHLWNEFWNPNKKTMMSEEITQVQEPRN